MFAPSLMHQPSSLTLPMLPESNPFRQESANLLSRAQQELNARFLQDRLLAPGASSMAPFGLNPAMHQHQHLHQHMHQHFLPQNGSSILPPGAASGSALSSSSLTAGYSNLNPSMRLSSLPGSRLGIPSPADLPLMASQLGPTLGVAGNLNGAFQPKSGIGMSSGLLNAAHLLLSPPPRDQLAPSVHRRKQGRWSVAHVRIAWEIHMHQQQKQLQSEVQHIHEENAKNSGLPQSSPTHRSRDQLDGSPLTSRRGDPKMNSQLEALYKLAGPSPYSRLGGFPLDSRQQSNAANERLGSPNREDSSGLFNLDWSSAKKSPPFTSLPGWSKSDADRLKIDEDRRSSNSRSSREQRDSSRERDQDESSNKTQHKDNLNHRHRDSNTNRSTDGDIKERHRDRTRSRSPIRSGSKDGDTPSRPTSEKCNELDADNNRDSLPSSTKADGIFPHQNPFSGIFPRLGLLPPTVGDLPLNGMYSGGLDLLSNMWNPLRMDSGSDQLLRRLGSQENIASQTAKGRARFAQFERDHFTQLMLGKIPPPPSNFPNNYLGYQYQHRTSSPAHLGGHSNSSLVPPPLLLPGSGLSSTALLKASCTTPQLEYR